MDACNLVTAYYFTHIDIITILRCRQASYARYVNLDRLVNVMVQCSSKNRLIHTFLNHHLNFTLCVQYIN